MSEPAVLYLIPSSLSESPCGDAFPARNALVAAGLRHFIVESARSAKRFLKALVPEIDIDSLSFYELNEHTDLRGIGGCLDPLKAGESIGVISEAGCPCVADPGAAAVALALKMGFRVKPLAGPSSVILALMASGLNGQSFAFNGYVPAKTNERSQALRALERRAWSEGQTQIFIEAPYRNEKLFDAMLKTLRDDTRLCVASDLTGERETVSTKTVREWKKSAPPALNKIPAIFLIGR